MLTVSIEASLKVFFKGYSVSGFGVQCSRLQGLGLSGIWVVLYTKQSLNPKPKP